MVFPALFYLSGFWSLDAILPGGPVKLLVLWLRFLLPALLLGGVCLLVWGDAQIGGPSAPPHIRLKLWLTLGAFACFLFGDMVILLGLHVSERGYARGEEVLNHIRFLDLPFVVSYVVLLWIYAANGSSQVPARELQLQAFLGGASALEMLVQSTMHACATLGRQE